MSRIYSFYTDKILKRYALDISEVTQYLWQKGWAERNAGNISVDITGNSSCRKTFLLIRNLICQYRIKNLRGEYL